MSIKKYSLLLFIYFYIVNAFSYAQSLATKHFTNNDGLSLSENFCLFQDSRGFIWVGINGGGVDVYNGKNFANYSIDQGLHDIVINSIQEDAQGNVWFASPNKGLCIYNGSTFSAMNLSAFRSKKINKIFKCNANELWALTESGIIRIQDASLKTLKLYDTISLFDNYLDAVSLNKSQIAINTENEITILHQQYNEFKLDFQIQTDFEISVVLPYDNERMLVGSRTGKLYLLNLRTKKMKFITEINHSSNYFKLKKIVKWNQQFLAGTDGNGLISISNDFKEIKPFKIVDLKTESILIVSDILVDFNNNLWVTTIGDGLIYLKSSKIKTFNEGFASSSDIFYITKKKDLMLIASYEFGLFSIDKNNKETLIKKKDKGNNYTGIKTLENNQTYCFMGPDLYLYDDIKNDLLPLNIKLSNENYYIIDVKLSKNNQLYLFSSLGVHDITDSKNIKMLYSNDAQNKKNHIITGIIDRKNNIWFSNSEASYILKNSLKLEKFDKISERCGESILSFMEDNLGNIWMLSNQCLVKYDGKTIEFIDSKKLFNKLFYSGYFSKINNTIYLGTNDGVVELRLDHQSQIAEYELIDEKSGFVAKECNQYAIYEENDGKKLWLGTIKGLVSINKSKLLSDTTMPKLAVIDLKMLLDSSEIKSRSTGLSKWFNIPENLELPYNKNHIAIGFTGIQYINPDKIKYRYKLNGFDTGYSPPSIHNYASFTNLPPGKYTLEVIANNNLGQWTKNPILFNFAVERPYWKTWWFYTIITIGIFAISSFYYYYRKRQVIALEKRLEEEVSKRTLVLKKQNKKIEILIKEIHHRVKNNLQVITSLINLHSGYVKDPKALEVFEESKNRIKSMALVHEKLYETNDLSSISVDDFILKMFDYLKDIYDESGESYLEKNITVEKLDIDTVIPLGLLINEIFSNAFKYALKESETKYLIVNLAQIKSNEFELKIKDSGKGFNYNEKRNAKSSFGLELIDLLVSQLNGHVTVNTNSNTEYIISFESIGKTQ